MSDPDAYGVWNPPTREVIKAFREEKKAKQYARNGGWKVVPLHVDDSVKNSNNDTTGDSK